MTITQSCILACIRSYVRNHPGNIHVDDLCYRIEREGNLTIVAIRGTANERNWWRDLFVIPLPSPKGYLAHGGFVRAFQKLYAAGIMDKAQGYNVVITGHSLGAGIATLLSEKTGFPLVTFGSPRVYTRLGGPDLPHTRIINDDDLVTMVPRYCYRHYCDPVINADGDGQQVEFKDHDAEVYGKRLGAL